MSVDVPTALIFRTEYAFPVGQRAESAQAAANQAACHASQAGTYSVLFALRAALIHTILTPRVHYV